MISPLELLPNTYRPFFGRFPSLTQTQQALIVPILQKRDVVVQERTGGGKTEAALAPVTEKLLTSHEKYTIAYIVPTRALALDMNRRIKPLYKQLGLKGGIRTGDGKHLWDAQPDLLITTPESLDVLLGSSNKDNQAFIKRLQVMIIDEAHVFVQTDRGLHLSYLKKRIEKEGGPLQVIALSATLGNPKNIIKLFSLKKNVFLYKQRPSDELRPCWVHLEDLENELSPFFDALFTHWKCKKILAFANTRKKCEEIYQVLSQSELFSKTLFLHYSNLSTRERRAIETSFRQSKTGVCIATTTLELGIDIGDVSGVVLIGAPPSSMAFLQRIGRGNRQERHKNFWGICQGAHAEHQLIQFLALYELGKENQVETLFLKKSSSVLVQQILSSLYAKQRLAIKALIPLCPAEELIPLFHHLASNKWLEQTKGGLYQGGWRYHAALKKKQIWSNFPPTSKEYQVILEKEIIASLPSSILKQLKIGDHMQFAGKALQILEIKEEALELFVKRSSQTPTKELFWKGCGVPISFEVAQKMKTILLSPSNPPGLLRRTSLLLHSAREKMKRAIKQPNGMYIYKTENGSYRYNTFLGTIGNFILHHLIQTQLGEKIEGLSTHFDEIGLRSSHPIAFHLLDIPYTPQKLQEWVALHIDILRTTFAWNSWLGCLPEKYQQKEIASRFEDPRVLRMFRRYQHETRERRSFLANFLTFDTLSFIKR